MIDALGDVGAKLVGAKPEGLADLYKRLDLQFLDTHIGREADVSINLTANVGNVMSERGLEPPRVASLRCLCVHVRMDSSPPN
ncbi:hypothetical protein [Lentzea sp. CA-135723]|uniref:hypothetical protein n=1 Tax=Lentzea sp. CA-135723 TaxID=3239950 RepID=UPI003D8F665B